MGLLLYLFFRRGFGGFLPTRGKSHATGETVIKGRAGIVENVGEFLYHSFRIGRDGNLTYNLVVHVEDGVEAFVLEFEAGVVGDIRSCGLNRMVESLSSLFAILTSPKKGLCIPLLLKEGEILLREGNELGELSITQLLPACGYVDRDFKPSRGAGGSESIGGPKDDCLCL
jgi:hypothetical protein